MPEELWTEVYDIVKEAVVKTIPEKRNTKWQNSCLRRPYKYLRREEKLKAKEKRERYTYLNAQCQRKQREIRNLSSLINAEK